MAKILIESGASTHEADFTGTHILQTAMQNKNLQIVDLLYPHAKNSLLLLRASDWRDLLQNTKSCGLEVVDGGEAGIKRVENIKNKIFEMSYPMALSTSYGITEESNNFMKEHQMATRSL
ncbi:MAG: hypothetical protein MMC23_009920 [Stictis urceolatum]|nr:hypothetical protein [Stictis urceolata]